MTTQLDPAQAVRNAYDDATGTFKVSGNTVDAYDVLYSYAIGFGSINGSGGATYQIVASTSAAIYKIVPNEQTGTALNFYKGANASETLICIIAPGQDNEVSVVIPAGTRLSVRAVGASAPAAGTFYVTLLG